MSPEAVLIVGRIAERLLITFFGGMSLWLGWRLFWARARVLEQQAEFSFKSFVVKFQRVAPGIFFAAFGAVLLSLSVWRPLTLSNPSSSISYLNDKSALEDLRAMNFIVQVSKIPPAMPIGSLDRESLQKKGVAFDHIRNAILSSIVGQDNFSLWLRYKDRLDQTPPEDRVRLAEIQRLLDDLGEL